MAKWRNRDVLLNPLLAWWLLRNKRIAVLAIAKEKGCGRVRPPDTSGRRAQCSRAAESPANASHTLEVRDVLGKQRSDNILGNNRHACIGCCGPISGHTFRFFGVIALRPLRPTSHRLLRPNSRARVISL